MRSIGDRLEAHRGLGAGFDFLRIFLACAIVAVHAFALTGNDPMISHSPLWFLRVAFVPMFFALSGFLITGSGMRLSLKNFLLNRGMRIFPALAVDIAVCALILGPLVTTVTWSTYFSDQKFFRYFLNIVGWVHYKLPGVFEYYRNSKVNGSLWTVPYEMLCYVFISMFIATKSLFSPTRVVICAITYWGVGVAFTIFGTELLPTRHLDGLIRILFLGEGSRIILAFLVGILMFQVRDKIPYSWFLAISCFLLCIFTPILVSKEVGSNMFFRPILVVALSYITVFLGVTSISIPAFFHRGDYSYGIYLYHYPMIHLVNTVILAQVAMSPVVRGLVTFPIALAMVMGLAYFSWHRIEKPTLAMRKRFSFVAKERGVSGAPQPVPADLSQTR